jgi:hypothetical protein
LIKLLPGEAITRFKEIDLSKMLNFKLDGLCSSKLYGLLMEKSVVHEDLDQTEVRIRDGQSLWITSNVVQHVLNLSTGSSKVLPNSEPESASAEYGKLYLALKHVATRHKVKKTSCGS